MIRPWASLAFAVILCFIGFYARGRAQRSEDAEARESFAMVAAAAFIVSIVLVAAATATEMLGG